MRSLILISVYLLKDILRNWVQTPGSLFARFSISLFLCLLYVLSNSVFLALEIQIENKIKNIGLSTIYLRTFENTREKKVPNLEKLFSSLSETGNFIPFHGTYLSAKLDKESSCRVIVFTNQTVAGLAKILPSIKDLDRPYFLLSSNYPVGLKKKIFLRDTLVEPEVVKMPRQLATISNNQSLLFLYDEYVQDLLKDALSPSFIYFGDDYTKNSETVDSIRALLQNENIQSYDLTSPLELTKEIEELRNNRLNVQVFFGLGIGWLLFLSFGSNAVFEFRQNLFVTALLKSFGVHPFFILLRYFGEGTLIALAGFLCALKLGEVFHGQLFDLLQISILGSEQALLQLFHPLANVFLISLLSASVLIGVLPIAWALKKPVGETLS